MEPCIKKKFKISLVPQIGGFFSDLSTEDNLNAVGEILIQDTKNRKMKIEELISKFRCGEKSWGEIFKWRYETKTRN